MNLRKRGRGYESKCTSYILGGKYPVFTLCVRTQIDFNLKGGITAHSDNKTRLKRFIFVHNGRYGRKQDGIRLKMYKYT